MFAQTLGDRWGSEDSPSGFELAYGASIDAGAPGFTAYANSIKAVGESLLDAYSRARLSLAMTDAQRAMIDIQLDRARQGLPPVQINTPAPVSNTTMLLVVAALVAVYLATRRG